jgi:hypothetical protein
LVRHERIGAGFDPAPFIIEVAQIVVQEADQPDLVVDLANAHGLAGESGGEVDFAQADADTSAAGDAGLADRPRTPRHSPQATSSAVVRKILYLRQNYHFGAGRIVAYLQRFHQVKIARSTVHRILVKNGMDRLPANQKHQPHRKRWKRYEKTQPGRRLRMDVKFLERIPGTVKRLYQFTAIDDRTRIRILTIYDVCNQREAIQFLNEVRKRLPFRILVLQTDNGAEFQSQFHWHAASLDIRHI